MCFTEHLVGLFSVRLMFFSCWNLFTMFLIIFCLLFVSLLSGILFSEVGAVRSHIFSSVFHLFIFSTFWKISLTWSNSNLQNVFYLFDLLSKNFFHIFKSISFSSYKSRFSLKIRVWGHLFLFSSPHIVSAPSVWVRHCRPHRQGVQGGARRPVGLGWGLGQQAGQSFHCVFSLPSS